MFRLAVHGSGELAVDGRPVDEHRRAWWRTLSGEARPRRGAGGRIVTAPREEIAGAGRDAAEASGRVLEPRPQEQGAGDGLPDQRDQAAGRDRLLRQLLPAAPPRQSGPAGLQARGLDRDARRGRPALGPGGGRGCRATPDGRGGLTNAVALDVTRVALLGAVAPEPAVPARGRVLGGQGPSSPLIRLRRSPRSARPRSPASPGTPARPHEQPPPARPAPSRDRARPPTPRRPRPRR